MSELLSTGEVAVIREQIECGMPLDPHGTYERSIAYAILGAGVLRLGRFEFDDGPSNNKLEMERLFRPENRAKAASVITGLGRLATRFRPDGLYGIPPNGGYFAQALGQVLELPVIDLHRVKRPSGLKLFEPVDASADSSPGYVLEDLWRLVGIKDVSATFGSVEDCLRSPNLARRTAAVVTVWARGEMAPFDSPVWDQAPLHALVYEPIPRQLSPGHELCGYAVREVDGQ